MSTTTRRTTPLAAPSAAVAPPTAAPPLPFGPPPTRPAPHDRLAGEVRTLKLGSSTVRLEERILMVLGGVIAPLGLVIVVLGWWGAAHTPHVFEQLPYLISGGLLGLSLVVLGAFLYFAHWLTQLIKEQRAQSRAVLDALERLAEEVAHRAPVPARPAVGTNGASPSAQELVATERGTMAHRPECVVVAGKPALRAVQPHDGLAACKLCEPYGP